MRIVFGVEGSPAFVAMGAYKPHKALDLIGLRFLGLIRRNFRNSVDPYGQAWAPLRSRKGQALLNTGRLLKSIGYIASSAEVRVGTNLIYAATHNQGLGWIPQRQFIPDEAEAPQAWIDIATQIFQEDIKKHVTRTARRAV